MSEENKDLGDKAEDAFDSAKEKAKDLGENASEKFDDAKESVKEFAGDAKEKASEFASDASDAAGEFADEAKKTANEFSDSAKEAFDNVGGENKKILAGILAIVFGGFGVHKFILGYTKEGIIQIVATFLTCGAASIVGFIEGIIYLTKSDEEFYNTYQVGKKPWF